MNHYHFTEQGRQFHIYAPSASLAWELLVQLDAPVLWNSLTLLGAGLADVEAGAIEIL